MKIHWKILALLLICWIGRSDAQRGILEEFLPQWRAGRDLLLNVIGPTSGAAGHLKRAEELHKLQPRLDDNLPFPCLLNNTRSEEPPKSVHRLRPGDIDVVGALGDSLTVGIGLTSANLFQFTIENRGISFSIGGQGTWRQFVTLPNILKEFNPNILGYSLRDSFGHSSANQLNAAEGGAMSVDMPYMAKVLIKRIKENQNINIEKHWKMINFMIGSNDFCADMCYRKNPEDIIEDHHRNVVKTLTVLRENLPRTIVNLIITPNLTTLANVTLSNRPAMCYITHNVECPCLFGLQFNHLKHRFRQVMEKWQQVELDIANYPEFDTDDFTVVAQPFTFAYNLPSTKNHLTDYSSFAEDCFHISQKEGARAATSLWNNLIEPVGSKRKKPFKIFNFKCPDQNHPFIYTRRNSF